MTTITPILKVALPGKSIASTNPRDFSLLSLYNSIKIFLKGGGTQTVAGSSNAGVTITHNAGFYPMCMVFAELTPGSGRWYARPFDISVENSHISSNTDDTNSNTSALHFKIVNDTGSSKNINYYYFVLGHNAK